MSDRIVNILGIDPGSIITGWCLLTNGKRKDSGVIKVSAKLDFEARRELLRDELMELYRRLWVSCKGRLSVALEDPQSRGMDVAKKLACIRTMFEERATDYRWPYIKVYPAEWQALLRRAVPPVEGEKIKALSLRGAYEAVGIEKPDEADAYWVARYLWEAGQQIS